MDVSPERIMQIGWSHVPQRALTAAVELDLFTHLANGAHTAAELAAASGASERGVRIVLDALTALGLAAKSNGGYANTPETETFLVQGKETYLGGLVRHTDLLWDNYGHLTESVQTGRPAKAVDEKQSGPDFFTKLVPLIFGNSYAQAKAAAEGLGVGTTWKGITVMDVGAGAAPWSLAMLQRDPTARAIAVDWPNVLEVTRQYTERFGAADRYEYKAGNLREVDYGEGVADLAVLGHICHSEGAVHSQELFAKLHRALRPGGKLLIADMLPDEDRCQSTFPLLFAVNMLLHSVEGDCFTLSEYEGWLKAAGYGTISTIENPGPSPLIVAQR